MPFIAVIANPRCLMKYKKCLYFVGVKLAYNLFFDVTEGEWIRRGRKKERGLWGNFPLELFFRITFPFPWARDIIMGMKQWKNIWVLESTQILFFWLTFKTMGTSAECRDIVTLLVDKIFLIVVTLVSITYRGFFYRSRQVLHEIFT